jgi:hypothetical protein
VQSSLFTERKHRRRYLTRLPFNRNNLNRNIRFPPDKYNLLNEQITVVLNLKMKCLWKKTK